MAPCSRAFLRAIVSDISSPLSVLTSNLVVQPVGTCGAVAQLQGLRSTLSYSFKTHVKAHDILRFLSLTPSRTDVSMGRLSAVPLTSLAPSNLSLLVGVFSSVQSTHGGSFEAMN